VEFSNNVEAEEGWLVGPMQIARLRPASSELFASFSLMLFFSIILALNNMTLLTARRNHESCSKPASDGGIEFSSPYHRDIPRFHPRVPGSRLGMHVGLLLPAELSVRRSRVVHLAASRRRRPL